jgi:hypothetical protein
MSMRIDRWAARTSLAGMLFSLLLLGACGDNEQASDSRARIYYIEDSLVSTGSVYASLDDGGTVWEFQPQDFIRVEQDSNRLAGPEVHTRANGTLRMTFRLVAGGGQTLSEGSLATPLSPNWRWSFEIVHAAKDPPLACSDCRQVTVYDLMDQEYSDDWIYVLWRGSGP